MRQFKQITTISFILIGTTLPFLVWSEGTNAQQVQAQTKVEFAPNHVLVQQAQDDMLLRSLGIRSRNQWEHQNQELIAKYRAAKDEVDRAKVAEEISKVVAEQFEQRQVARETELRALEEQVKKLREIHAKRSVEKPQIVKDRVRQLLREADGLGWGIDESNPFGHPSDGPPSTFRSDDLHRLYQLEQPTRFDSGTSKDLAPNRN